MEGEGPFPRYWSSHNGTNATALHIARGEMRPRLQKWKAAKLEHWKWLAIRWNLAHRGVVNRLKDRELVAWHFPWKTG